MWSIQFFFTSAIKASFVPKKITNKLNGLFALPHQRRDYIHYLNRH